MKAQKLKSIFLFYFLFSICIIHANAQIVYTDVNPDVTINGTYNLDVNNDGINDYSISKTSTSFPCTKLGTLGNIHNYINVYEFNGNVIADTIGLPAAFISGININNGNYLWSNANHLLRSYSTSTHGWPNCAPYGTPTYSGNFPGSVDKYLGLKFTVGANTFYGWARLSVAVNASSCTIKDYAYNSIPNQPILSGETSCTTPTVTLSASGPLSFCAGDSVTLTANGTGYLYQWKKGGVNISGATSQTYVAKTAGTYKCKATNSCGYKISGGKTVVVPCRISTENFAETFEHLSVFPNPATNTVTIKFPSDEAGEISIVNLFGQIAFFKTINTEQTQIDISKYPSGIYVVRWNSGANNETKIFSVIK